MQRFLTIAEALAKHLVRRGYPDQEAASLAKEWVANARDYFRRYRDDAIYEVSWVPPLPQEPVFLNLRRDMVFGRVKITAG